MLIPRHRPKARRFRYEPRTYDPDVETDEERRDAAHRRRLRFESKTRRGKQPAFIALAVLLLIALYLYTTL